MEHKTLGRSNLKIPVLGLGTWGIGGFSAKSTEGDDLSVAALRLGLDLGMRFIDTAEIYAGGHSEEVVAKAIRNQRDSVFLATKVSAENLTYDGVLKSCNASLKRLDTAYIDLYQVHWPSSRIPISDTMKAMERLAKDGKIRHVGVSNFSMKQTKEAQEALSSLDLASNQVEYSLNERSIENDLLPYAEQEGITIVAYSPLARGLISRSSGDRWRLIDEIASKYHKTRSQVALNWLIEKGPVVAIPKARDPQHLHENAGAQGWRMLKEDSEALSRAFT